MGILGRISRVIVCFGAWLNSDVEVGAPTGSSGLVEISGRAVEVKEVRQFRGVAQLRRSGRSPDRIVGIDRVRSSK